MNTVAAFMRPYHENRALILTLSGKAGEVKTVETQIHEGDDPFVASRLAVEEQHTERLYRLRRYLGARLMGLALSIATPGSWLRHRLVRFCNWVGGPFERVTALESVRLGRGRMDEYLVSGMDFLRWEDFPKTPMVPGVRLLMRVRFRRAGHWRAILSGRRLLEGDRLRLPWL